MASRVMHLAIANEIMKQVHIEDVERFRLGVVLPDAYKHNIQSATDSHLKYTTENGTKKTYKLAWFREIYGERMKTDELYLGYYLHLIQDTIFRYFVYSLHNWDPYPKGNIERLHNDYKLLNNYVVNEYNISKSLVIPEDINEEPIFEIYPFDVEQLSADFKTDFEPYNDGKAFFFTQKMADEYIKMATGKCLEEIKALESGTSTFNELDWAWDKNPPKQSVLQMLKNMVKKQRNRNPIITIEPLKLEDYHKCSNIWNMKAQPLAEKWREEIAEGSRLVYVYKINGEFIGEGALVLDTGDPDYTIAGKRVYVSRMVVKKEYRGRGIGSEILEFLINKAKEMGFSEMTIGVDKDNENALHLYRKYGFTEVLFDGADEDGEYYKLMKRI